MKNKKVIIAVVIVLVIVVAAVVGIMVLKPFDKDDEEKKAQNETNTVSKENESDVDYEGILTKFAESCYSEDDMEDFVDNYVDFKSWWAVRESDTPYDFSDNYAKAEESDYEDEEIIDAVKEFYGEYVVGEKLEVSDIEEDGDFSDIGIEEWTVVNFTLKGKESEEEAADDEKSNTANTTNETNTIDEEDYEETELSAIFCEDKIVVVALPEDIEELRELTEESDDDEEADDDEDLETELQDQENEIFNSQFELYEGDSVSGTQVKSLIDTVISSNSVYEADEYFVTITTLMTDFDDTDLVEAAKTQDVDKTAEALGDLKNSIVASKKYEVNVFQNADGRVDEIWIDEVSE